MTDKQLYIYPFLISFVSFLLGAIATFWMNLKKPEEARSRWVKYLVYLFITQLTLSLMIFKPDWFIYFSFLISFGIAIDLRKSEHAGVHDRTHWILVCLAIGFQMFALLGEQEDLIRTYILVFCFDGYSQIYGQLFGKSRITKISPNKTWEGLIGGAMISTAIMLLFWNEERIPGLYVLEVLVLIAAAFMGDILASKRKRTLKIKDFGNYIPYHGGSIDRFDSLMGAFSMAGIIQLIRSF